MLDKILSIIADRLKIDIEKISAESNLFELEADSLDLINIIMDVEYSLSVHFEDEEIVDIRTPKDIEELCAKKHC